MTDVGSNLTLTFSTDTSVRMSGFEVRWSTVTTSVTSADNGNGEQVNVFSAYQVFLCGILITMSQLNRFAMALYLSVITIYFRHRTFYGQESRFDQRYKLYCFVLCVSTMLWHTLVLCWQYLLG